MGNDSNQFELDNFNLNSTETAWNPVPTRDPRDLGGRISSISQNPNAIPVQNQTETIEFAPPVNPMENLVQNPSEIPQMTPEATRMIPETPQISQEIAGKPQEISREPIDKLAEATINTQYAKESIKTDDKLAEAGVEAVDKAITKLSKDGDVASFYNSARQMMEDNLENSYNRKLGA